MKRLLKATLAASCLGLVALPAHAQAAGFDVKVNPRIGAYVPLSDITQAQAAGAEIVEEMTGSLALGLGVELQLPVLPFSIRGNLDYATGSEVRVTEDGVERDEGVETTLLAVSGDLVFRPLPQIILVQPYVFAGGGLKQYDVGDEATLNSFRDESDPTLHVGGGLDLSLGPLAVNAEVGDYISWYDVQAADTDETETQHDLFVTVGISIGLL